MSKKLSPKERVRVSLLPQERQAEQFARADALRFKMIALSVILAVLGIAAIAVLQVLNSRMREELRVRQAAVRDMEAQSLETSPDVAQAKRIAREIGFAKTLLETHAAGENILEVLERTVIPEVTLLQVSADTAGSVTVAAVARDVTDVARQTVVWSADSEIAKVKVADAAMRTDSLGKVVGADFSATLTLHPATLRWKP